MPVSVSRETGQRVFSGVERKGARISFRDLKILSQGIKDILDGCYVRFKRIAIYTYIIEELGRMLTKPESSM